MGLSLELEESDFKEHIDDGIVYVARVLGIKLKEKPYKDDDGNPVKKVEWKFKIISDDDQNDREIWGETSTKFVDHPDCKLKNWSEAALGRILPVGYRIDTDDCLDRDVRIRVGLREYTKDGQDKKHNFVADVLPTRENVEKMKAQIDADDEPF